MIDFLNFLFDKKYYIAVELVIDPCLYWVHEFTVFIQRLKLIKIVDYKEAWTGEEKLYWQIHYTNVEIEDKKFVIYSTFIVITRAPTIWSFAKIIRMSDFSVSEISLLPIAASSWVKIAQHAGEIFDSLRYRHQFFNCNQRPLQLGYSSMGWLILPSTSACRKTTQANILSVTAEKFSKCRKTTSWS